ncbi:hypothetical protein F2P81_008234 [Scophthalmus maximus]|uniref:Uncharacterized protein n=1 Tax=Scophthalmus maximus TaxID=52904 RepID=A0A6A4T505_SCOMX|nr:hypothetical protein F2P81_008234 [Scophthalmus maximus]
MVQMPEINVNDKGICNPPDSEILGIKGSSSSRRWRRDDSLSGTRTAIGCLRLLPVKKVRKSRKKKPNPSQRGPKLDGKRQLSTRTRGPCRRIDVLQGAKKCHRKCTNRCYRIRNTCLKAMRTGNRRSRLPTTPPTPSPFLLQEPWKTGSAVLMRQGWLVPRPGGDDGAGRTFSYAASLRS